MNNVSAPPPKNRVDQQDSGPWPPAGEDEVSLIELWNTLVRRRLLMALLFVLVLATAGVYLLTQPPVAVYSATGEMRPASVAGTSYEGPAGWPSTLAAEHMLDEVTVDGHITVTVEGESAGGAEERVRAALDAIATEQQAWYDESLDRFEQRLAVSQTAFAAAQNAFDDMNNASGENAVEMMLAQLDLISRLPDLSDRVADLERLAGRAHTHPPELLAPIAVTTSTAGPNLGLILALSIVLGAMVAIFGAFFAEFLSHARQQRETAS